MTTKAGLIHRANIDSDRIDRDLMRAALGLARRALGSTWPNPAVGCILHDPVADQVLARGWTAPSGRPHAETEALSAARRRGIEVRGATAYVSFEPCSHHGQTPPCADALIEAGIARTVVACLDPDPRVCGQGIEKLTAAGIEVTTGVLEADAEHLNGGFIARITGARPLVTWKTATGLDSRIALAGGESRWITGPEARRMAHLLRAQSDAIAIGAATARLDDPDLTCRIPGLEARSPVRVVFDADARLPSGSRLVASAREHPVWLIASETADQAVADRLAEAGVEILRVPAHGTAIDVREALALLAERGITRLLLEGGGALAASFLRAELVDEIAWFRAGVVMGGDARPVAADLALAALADAPRFEHLGTRSVGPDMLDTYRRAH